jgi:hypothetical protein
VRFPSKVTPYGESILPMAGELMERIPRDGLSVLELFRYSKTKGCSTSDFFQILDFLYMIGRLEVNRNKEVCHVG